LWALIHDARQRTTFYPDAHAVMPSVTNTNHAAIMTATYAEANGIVGNWFWEREPGIPPTSSEFARLLQVETLFTVIEKDRPGLTTAALFGKSRLVDLFAAVPRHQRPPDVLWGDVASETEMPDAHGSFGSDQRTMDELLRTIAMHDPDLMFAALGDVDRTAHSFGPDSNEARKAVLEADRQIRRLVSWCCWRDRIVSSAIPSIRG
jgi:phosphonoacetate hydrolase